MFLRHSESWKQTTHENPISPDPLVNIQKTMENHHFQWENQGMTQGPVMSQGPVLHGLVNEPGLLCQAGQPQNHSWVTWGKTSLVAHTVRIYFLYVHTPNCNHLCFAHQMYLYIYIIIYIYRHPIYLFSFPLSSAVELLLWPPSPHSQGARVKLPTILEESKWYTSLTSWELQGNRRWLINRGSRITLWLLSITGITVENCP